MGNKAVNFERKRAEQDSASKHLGAKMKSKRLLLLTGLTFATLFIAIIWFNLSSTKRPTWTLGYSIVGENFSKQEKLNLKENEETPILFPDLTIKCKASNSGRMELSSLTTEKYEIMCTDEHPLASVYSTHLDCIYGGRSSQFASLSIWFRKDLNPESAKQLRIWLRCDF